MYERTDSQLLTIDRFAIDNWTVITDNSNPASDPTEPSIYDDRIDAISICVYNNCACLNDILRYRRLSQIRSKSL
jgi:hypothetical protein